MLFEDLLQEVNLELARINEQLKQVKPFSEARVKKAVSPPETKVARQQLKNLVKLQGAVGSTQQIAKQLLEEQVSERNQPRTPSSEGQC